MPEYAGHYALVVGIDHYPRFRSLKGARKDAEDFHAWLTDPEGGGVLAANVELVLSREDPVRPIHDDIDDALERILAAARNVAGDKRLYVYFSGHGLGRTNVGADLCLASWSKQRRAMALDSEGYRKLVMGCGYFREVVFLLDCCRVREVGSTALPPTIELPTPGDGAPTCRSFVGYATEFMNAAYEAEIGQADGESDVRGHFTQALMNALKGAAAEPTGGVRASKLKEYLEVNTPLIAKASNHIQNSEVVNGLDTTADPLFGHAKPPAQAPGFAVNLVFRSVAKGEAVVEDGQLRELKRGDVSTGPWRIPVSGRTMLLLRYLPTGAEKTIRVQGNETEDLHVEL
ncbi:caspase family protein [Pseudomonas cavernicola]|uniref:Caspase family protein n=1 Tax=Pseudomonas cavernicola TaxID=2320866 RepID=A0A418X969_9PSED|nr:caspase family protein [Pseudomonas cavernicola]RJG09035.1 caspase family protein [Pseudomonas cavernicola]